MARRRPHALALCALAAVVVLLGLGGCGGKPILPPPPGSTANPLAPSPYPSPSPVEKPLVFLARQGGLAGVADELTVYPTGRYTLVRGKASARKGTLTAAELGSVKQLMGKVPFDKVAPTETAGAVADAYSYLLVVDGHQLYGVDGGLAASVRSLVTELSTLVDKYGKR
jgi:hypothetical protein